LRTPLSEKDRKAWKKPDATVLAYKKTEAEKPPNPQNIAEQMLKYIPAETIAFYVPALALLGTIITLEYGTAIEEANFELGIHFVIFRWVIFSVALVASLLYMYKTAKSDLEKDNIDNPKPRAILKSVLSAVAFLFWAVTVGGPFDFIKYYETIGALLALAFTLFNPLIYYYIPIPSSKK